MELNIDKTGWKSYRFDELAQNISQRVEPKQTDLEVYVGLEHLDPDNLHIKRNGTPADVEGTKLKFYKGDVIFGKRRAYQRKAALAETDGICSAHAMVLRANTKLIDERLFPFFFHSKVFQDISVKISVGGLSPTINWKDLSKQEFLLPPNDQQARLAEMLWAADEVVEREMEVKERAVSLKRNTTTLFFDRPLHSWEERRLGDLCQIERGGSPRPIDDYFTNDKDGINWIKIGDVEIGTKYIYKTKQKIKPSGLSKSRYVKKGDLLLSNSMSFGRPFILEIDGCIHDGWLVIHDENNVFNKEFLYYYLGSESTYNKFKKFAAGGVVDNLNSDVVKKMKVYLPTLSEQKEITSKLLFLDDIINKVELQLSNSNNLKQGLINEIF